MLPRLLWCVVYVLCADFATCQDVTLDIPGPEFLVVDGSRNLTLTLTCPNATQPVDRYSWLTPGPETRRCRTTGRVCTFQPMLKDDDQNVSCIAFNTSAGVIHQAVYKVNLAYPPQSSPVITTDPPGKHTLQQGENITCTVSGGKPRVTNVTFYCDPGHADQEDDVSNDGGDVSSSISVNMSLATNGSINCTCFAYWKPEPGLYNNTTQQEFTLAYRAPEINFTETTVTPLLVPAPAGCKLSVWQIVVIVLGCVFFLVMVIVIFIAFKKCRGRRQGNENQGGRENCAVSLDNIYTQPPTGPVQYEADDYDHLGRLRAPPARPDPTYSHTNTGFVMS